MRIKRLIVGMMVCISSTAAANVIGYGWTSSTLPIKSQEWFYMGFDLGFKDHYKGKNANIIKTVSDKSGSLSSARPVLEKLLDANVKVVTGFTTSHDALLASSILNKRNEDILALYIGPGHSALANAGKNIYTTGESMELASHAMLGFAVKHFSGRRGLVVSNPEAVFSVNNRDTLQQLLKKPDYQILNLDFVSMTTEMRLPESTILDIKSGKYQYLVMTAYAEESASVLQQLNQQPRQYPILANSSWAAIELVRRMLTERRAPTYITSLWVKGGKDSMPFERRVRSVYGVEANTEMSYGYDAGLILAETLNRISGVVSRESIVSAFKSNSCFKGTSTGTLCFEKNGGYARRQLHPMKFSVINGFEPVDVDGTDG